MGDSFSGDKRFLRLNIRTMLYLGFGAMLAIVLYLALIGWHALNLQTRASRHLSYWINVQENVHTNILDPLIGLERKEAKWLESPTQANWILFNDAFNNAQNKIQTFISNLSGDQFGLDKTGIKLEKHIYNLSTTIGELGKSWLLLNKAEKNMFIAKEQIIALLNKEMSNYIDPMRYKAYKSGNINLFYKAANIDMIANEEITQPVYRVLLAIEAYAAGKGNATKVENLMKQVNKGLNHWAKLVQDTPIRSSLKNIEAEINNIQQQWLIIKRDLQQFNNLKNRFDLQLANIQTILNQMIKQKVDPNREREIEHAQSIASFGNKVFAIGVAIALLLGLITSIIIYYYVINPLSRLSNHLKEMARGKSDLTKQLPVDAVNCSQILKCGQKDCPCYGKPSHCWYEAGSYAEVVKCPQILSGKYSTCEKCPVYKKAITNEIEEVATFINAFIRRMHKGSGTQSTRSGR